MSALESVNIKQTLPKRRQMLHKGSCEGKSSDCVLDKLPIVATPALNPACQPTRERAILARLCTLSPAGCEHGHG